MNSIPVGGGVTSGGGGSGAAALNTNSNGFSFTIPKSSRSLQENINEGLERKLVASFSEMQAFTESFQRVTGKSKKFLDLIFSGSDTATLFGFVESLSRLEGISCLQITFVSQKLTLIETAMSAINRLRKHLNSLSLKFKDCDFSESIQEESSADFAELSKLNHTRAKEIHRKGKVPARVSATLLLVSLEGRNVQGNLLFPLLTE